MTHSSQYVKNLPHTRKKLNAAFVHRLKKLCGHIFHYHVVEVFGDEDNGDYVYVLVSREDAKGCILALCKAYGIGNDYIDIFEDIEGEGEYIQVYLSQPKPFSD